MREYMRATVKGRCGDAECREALRGGIYGACKVGDRCWVIWRSVDGEVVNRERKGCL